VESGDCYRINPHTGLPSKLPSNLSGGLIGCMHAVGATGIMQTFKITTHIWNRWAQINGDSNIWNKFNRKKPDDWSDLQVSGANRALAISHAGVGSHVTTTILMDPDHLLQKDV
jgi:acetyl-CoA C-acetyltransferase